MNAVLKTAEGVPCRACGAVLAPASGNDYGLCANCWKSAVLHSGAAFDSRKPADQVLESISAEKVNVWLARRLVAELKRFKRDGMAGRCEAISGWAYGRAGTQCANHATEYRDGRKVCYLHARANEPVFVGQERSDQYAVFRDLIRDLSHADPKFAAAVREGMASDV